MSFEVDPPYTAQERNGILLMCLALLGALCLFSYWIQHASEIGAKPTPIPHASKRNP